MFTNLPDDQINNAHQDEQDHTQAQAHISHPYIYILFEEEPFIGISSLSLFLG